MHITVCAAPPLDAEAASSIVWSPDDLSLAAMQTTQRGKATVLQLCHVSSAEACAVSLPKTSSWCTSVAFSPDSSEVLCVSTQQQVAFVSSASGGTMHTQSVSGLPDHVSAVAWSSAGYAVFAAHSSERLCVGLISGQPSCLQLLHDVQISSRVAGLAFSASGLVCAWIDHDAAFMSSLTTATHAVRQGNAAAVVCDLASGRLALAGELQTCSMALPGRPGVGSIQLKWLADDSMLVLGPSVQMSNSWDAGSRQLQQPARILSLMGR